MQRLRFRFVFYNSLFFTLFFVNEFVSGQEDDPVPVKKRQVINYATWNYNNSSNYPSQTNNNPNYQSGTGRLYPTLDFTSPGQIDPGFSPHYHMGLNWTYEPNFNWGNGNGNSNRYPSGSFNRYPSGSFNRYPSGNTIRYPSINRYPNRNYSDFNLNNPYGNELPGNLVAQNNLPISRTTCGKTLCSYVPNYPTKEIGNAVNRARDVLRSGNSNALRNNGLNLQTFTSKTNTPWVGPNSGNRGMNPSNTCRTKTNTIYPHEGFSSDNNQAYYVVNVPSLGQAISSIECESGNIQTCNQRVGGSMSGTKTCQQAYRREQLLAVPFGKRYYDVNDFQLRTFHVPAGCYCMSTRPY